MRLTHAAPIRDGSPPELVSDFMLPDCTQPLRANPGCTYEIKEPHVRYFDNLHIVIEHNGDLQAGTPAKVEVKHDVVVDAIVMWTAEGLCGLRVLGQEGSASAEGFVPNALSDGQHLQPVEIFEPPEPIGARICRVRRERGLTQDELATAIGVSKPTVWKWEQGQNKSKGEMLERISKALATPVSEFTRPQGMLRSGVDVIKGCRFYIARACNVPPASVRISIEV